MRLLDFLRTNPKARHERKDLAALCARLQRYTGAAEGRRNDLCASVIGRAFRQSAGEAPPLLARAAWQLCQALLADEGHLHLPTVDLDRPLSITQMWELKASITRALVPFEQPDKAELLGNALVYLVRGLTDGLPLSTEAPEKAAPLSVPLYALLRDLPSALETVFGVAFNGDLIRAGLFERLRARLDANVCAASGINPDQPNESRKAVLLPGKSDLPPAQFVATYLAGTPLLDFLETPLPFSLLLPHAL